MNRLRSLAHGNQRTTDETPRSVVGKSHYSKNEFLADDPFQDSPLDISPCRPSRKLSSATLFSAATASSSSSSSTTCSFLNKKCLSEFALHPVDLDREEDSISVTSYSTYSTTSSFDSDSSADTTSTTIEQTKKVRFQIDENDEIYENITSKSYSRYDLTPKDVRNAWWSRAERRQMRQSITEQCEFVVRNQPKYRRAALKTISIVSQHANNAKLETELSTPEFQDALQILVHPDARGLERDMFARLQIPRRNVQVHIITVLRTQEMLKDIQGYSEDDKLQLIADQYSCNANFSKQLATVLAQGDAEAIRRDSYLDTKA
jgi:hypothetical protein